MAERKDDLVVDLARGGTTGGNNEKVLMAIIDETKDQVASENRLPLSPQWLYAKPNESKDIRQPITLLPGSSSDNIQKDPWRLDGSQDKKERRRNVPDIETSRRWRDEERDTGLLGRRERRKEGDREVEFRKGDRRSDSNSREAADSRALPSSDRRHEVAGRNSSHDGRRDSKWSSRWGPEDKEKDSRIERKMDADKDDQHPEKLSLGGSNRSLAESDSRDKWRPRHRQEAHTGGSSVFRAAPGFGLERGRVEGSTVGFAPGRGRANFVGGLPFSRPSSGGPIGAAPASKRSGLSQDTFCYPRGKLLDIYRKQKMLPHFDKTPAALEDVPPITQSSFTSPLAFVTPGAEEETVLEDISKGEINSSEACRMTSTERMARVDGATDVGDTMLVENKKMFPTNSALYGAPLNKDLYPLDEQICTSGEVSKVNTYINGVDPGSTAAIVSETFSVERVSSSIHTNSDLQVVGSKFVNDGPLGHQDHLGQLEGRNLIASFDDSTKLPDDSNSLFGTSFIQDAPSNGGQYRANTEVNKLVEPLIPPEELTLLYRDPQGDLQGPFLGVDIIQWFKQGFFGIDLPVCLSDAPEDTPFQPLGELMPHLKLDSDSSPVYTGEQSEPSDTMRSNTEANNAGPDFTASVADGLQWKYSGCEGSLDPHFQGRDSMDPHYGRLPHFNSDNSASNFAAESQSLHEFGGQDSEVLYTARPASSSDNPLGKLASELADLSRKPSDHQFLRREGQPNLVNQRTNDNDLNPLGLLWSELEEAHSKQPLSSKLASISDHGHISNAFGTRDASLFRQEQEQFSMLGDFPVIHDAWPSKNRRNTSSNVLHDAMDSSQFAQFEQEANHFNLEEHLLSQQLQKQQQLQQQHLLSHQNMHMTVPFLEQVQGSLQRQQSMNRSMPDLEQHLVKLQLQERHLQQLQQQQLQQLQQQQGIHHQMQLMQQQQQQQEQQLLLEHLLQQQLHDPGFGATHADQVLFRQQLLRELQQQAHHVPRHHEPSIEQLIQAKLGLNVHPEHLNELLERQYLFELQQEKLSRQRGPLLPADQQLLLDLQQEQLQAQQFSLASRQQLAMDEERNLGVWSVGESGQFIRTTASPHQSRAARLSQLDFPQPLHRPSSFEQPSHLERNFGGFHERSERGNFETKSQLFERTASISAGTPGPNIEIANALARLQGFDVQELHGQIHPSGHQRGHIPPSTASHQHRVPNQFSTAHLDAMESHWYEHNGKLSSSLTESQINQFHLEAENQKRQMKLNMSGRESNAWTSLVGNDENMNPGLADLLHHNMVLQSSQSLELGDTVPASYEHRDPARLFSRPTSDHSITDSFRDTSRYNKVELIQQDSLMNTSMERFEGNARLTSRSNSGTLFEHKQLFSDMEDIEKDQFADSTIGDVSVNRMDLLKMEGKRVKKRGSKGKINKSVLDFEEIGVEAGGSVMEHGELEVNAPIRHASFGTSGGGMHFYNYDTGVDNSYGGDLVNNRVTGILSRGPDNQVMKISSHGTGSELSSAPSVKGKNATASTSSEEGRRESGVNSSENTTVSRKEMHFRQTSSSSDAPEASFIDMLKSTKKMVPSEAEASSETQDAGTGGKGGNKKKGKKGRQIDPSLLGFKVHSNRIMMGEIQGLDD
ncbi:uncharacterized protein M6B38_204310 [Iris pallida]|uniref:GYF domain-containing protein n=1 Tax=Iris pallida TaxID=29817 RepID=A0AAX6E788_IRIPA|nr:uncharacterized protein M6B38_204310 [Iris pallida]